MVRVLAVAAHWRDHAAKGLTLVMAPRALHDLVVAQ